MRARWILTAALAACAVVACSSSDTDPDPPGAGGTPGAGGLVAASGGTPAGGVTSTGGVIGSGGLAASGGTPSVPPGQLFCGGKQCRAGGICATDGSCPAFLGGCFPAGPSGFSTCKGYCEANGAVCAQEGCYPDGSAGPDSYTWMSFAVAECPASRAPKQVSFDSCVTTIGLTKPIPSNEVVRCCCRG